MKRRLQFSVKSLMLWLVLVGLALGWWIDHSRSASRVAELEGKVRGLTHVLEDTKTELSIFGIDLSYSVSLGKWHIHLSEADPRDAAEPEIEVWLDSGPPFSNTPARMETLSESHD